ncbi:hypothetical protein CR203_18060 [Salipaludibacillus neizhouensis]|uniref:PRD domain-containing protein n=1 Tax=Salipaludibacillus neizhouensis TaxID=885475 RepID=A0A3A9KEN0_9BACI|nr:PRD domain-containing protein [Salipaludibacillus neizhouensis]RKL65975.1 hypothetical protein CR203_18060 [Salipaludibacillus neizhouensis]
MKGPFNVQKILNNNVVIAESSSHEEVIFIGKGIGFGKKFGDTFEATYYEKIYSLVDEREKEKYIHLVTKETEETLLIIHEAIEKIHDSIGFQIEDTIHFAITQHLALALQRTRDGTDIQNPFLTETKWLYYDTYKIAEDIVAFLFQATELKLPDAEIGFITLHIQSAIRHTDTMISPTSDLFTRCVKYVEEKMVEPNKKDTRSFRRFTGQLKNMIQDPLDDVASKVDKEIILSLKKNNPLCYNISRNVIRMIEKSADLKISDAEVIQLMISLRSLIAEQHNKA